MTPQEWLADFLEHGSEGHGSDGRPVGGSDGPQVPADDQLAAARSVRRRLAEPGTWVDPPDGLLERILQDIAAEQGHPTTPTEDGTPDPSAVPTTIGALGTPSRPARSRRTWIRRSIAIGAAAAGLAAAAVVGFVVTGRPTATELALSGTRLAPGANATAQVRTTPSGLSIVLDVRSLPPSPPGFYYQAWLKGPRGLVAIGTFHLHGGPGTVDLWSAVGLADYPTLTVTREPEDGNPASSGQVVLTTHP